MIVNYLNHESLYIHANAKIGMYHKLLNKKS